MIKSHMSKRYYRICLFAILIALIIFTSACNNPNQVQSSPDIDTVKPVPQGENHTVAAVSMDDGKELALERAGINAEDAIFVKAKMDYDDGILVYELEFVSGDDRYEVEVNTVSGEILKYEVKPVENLPAKLPAGIIAVDKAKSIALDNANAETVTFSKVQLDRDDGQYIYEINFIAHEQEYKYEIDASTGEIIDRESNLL